jgi:hypothetical protein
VLKLRAIAGLSCAMLGVVAVIGMAKGHLVAKSLAAISSAVGTVGFLVFVWSVTGLVLLRLERSSWLRDRAHAALDSNRLSRATAFRVAIPAAILVTPISIAAFLSAWIGLAAVTIVEVCIFGISAVLLLVVVVLHRLPRGSRTLKYQLLVAAVMTMWLFFQPRLQLRENSNRDHLAALEHDIARLCDVDSQFEALSVHNAELVVERATTREEFAPNQRVLWWPSAPPGASHVLPQLYCLLAAFLMGLLLRGAVIRRSLYSFAIRAGPFVMASVTLLPYAGARYSSADMFGAESVAGTVCCAVVIVYALMRYQAGSALAAHPILYLRSFSGTSTAETFGKVVARAVGHQRVVVGLAHSTQSAGELFADTHWSRQASLYSAPDEQWKRWVTAQLQIADFAIIDLAEPSPGVLWEVGEATRILQAGKIVLLVRDDDTIAQRRAANSKIIRVGRTNAEMRAARHELSNYTGANSSAAVYPATGLFALCAFLLIVALSIPFARDDDSAAVVRDQLTWKTKDELLDAHKPGDPLPDLRKTREHHGHEWKTGRQLWEEKCRSVNFDAR